MRNFHRIIFYDFSRHPRFQIQIILQGINVLHKVYCSFIAHLLNGKTEEITQVTAVNEHLNCKIIFKNSCSNDIIKLDSIFGFVVFQFILREQNQNSTFGHKMDLRKGKNMISQRPTYEKIYNTVYH